MKIHLANYQPDRLGGGWSFANNFVKMFGQSDYEDSDIYLIPSPTMCQRSEVEQAKADGKKIVLRIDNAVRNSRNRNTGMTRMYDFAQMADRVVFQSQWAKDYLKPFIKVDGSVILNSTDTDTFKIPSTYHMDYHKNYLYSRFNRDETKNWEVARYWFSQRSQVEPELKLHIVGNFSPELVEGYFDFYNQEKYQFYGQVHKEQMADIYRHCKYFIYTYFNDACSNSLIEALVSGCKIVGNKYYLQTGGAKEIMQEFKANGRTYFGLDRMANEYREVFNTL